MAKGKSIMLKIDKNIPIPDVESKGRERILPIREMEIGDSILLECEYTRIKHASFLNSFRNFSKKSKDCNHYKFLSRKVNNGIRVWRIE